MRKLLLGLIAVLLVLVCVLVGVGFYFISNTKPTSISFNNTPSTAATEAPPTVATTLTMPTVAATSTPPVTNSTLNTLIALELPPNNPLEVVPRFKKVDASFATPATARVYQVGEQATFWLSRDVERGTNEMITATLRYVTPHSYMWLENGERASDADIKKAGDTFENKIYPTDRRYLGGEASPGVDNDPHIYILNTHFNGAIGYFSSSDQLPPSIYRFSNQHEMFYMNVRSIRPGSEGYAATLAHEFVHMIHANHNQQEGTWITEGLGDLGIKLNGLPVGHEGAFADDPDLQLNAWGDKPNNSIPHYGASYVFLAYLLNRFGEGFTRDIVASSTRDIATVQNALDKHAPGLKFDDVFGDWVVANFVNDRRSAPRYFYPEGFLSLEPTASHSQYPVSKNGTVHQYGADYVELRPGRRNVTFTFDGSKQVQVLPTQPHSGNWMWWGNHADQSDTRLTREVDLSNLTRATLKFWTWYDIEHNFDYGYVAVSSDGGKTWATVPGRTTTTEDPNGANFGNGLTCRSNSGCEDDAPAPRWIEEQMDLSAYAGKKILLRFEYVSDQTTSGNGFAVDDISIPELNFSDDAEQDNGWQAEGFARIDNVLPQRFILQAIEFGSTIRVRPIALDQNNHATYQSQELGNNISRVVIVISGSTPITWETATYSYQVQ